MFVYNKNERKDWHMKILATPIDTIFFSTTDGALRPLRFKYTYGDDSKIVVVDRIIKVEKTKRAGEDALIFTCESIIENVKKIYELRYTLSTTTWVLYKM